MLLGKDFFRKKIVRQGFGNKKGGRAAEMRRPRGTFRRGNLESKNDNLKNDVHFLNLKYENLNLAYRDLARHLRRAADRSAHSASPLEVGMGYLEYG